MESEAEKVVRKWREFFEGKGAELELRHRKAVLEGDAAYQRKHGREDVALAVETLAREVSSN